MNKYSQFYFEQRARTLIFHMSVSIDSFYSVVYLTYYPIHYRFIIFVDENAALTNAIRSDLENCNENQLMSSMEIQQINQTLAGFGMLDINI